MDESSCAGAMVKVGTGAGTWKSDAAARGRKGGTVAAGVSGQADFSLGLGKAKSNNPVRH